MHTYTRRFATGNPNYPYETTKPVLWREEADDVVARFELPPMQAGQLIVPSLSAVGTCRNWSATWHLRNGDRRWRLDRVPSSSASDSQRPGDGPDYVETQIDCFLTLHAIEVSFLELRLHDAKAPAEVLIVIASGPFKRSNPDAGSRTASPCLVPSRSQMEAEASIRRHICSPTCLSMVMALDDRETARFVQDCFDPVRKMYGIWPRNIRAANARGFFGAMETFDSLDEAAEIIDKGVPIITSIRFAQGELSGAPLTSTGGHLVVLRGISRHRVLVNDPAASRREQVEREYDRQEFARVWLGTRGVGYVLVSNSSSCAVRKVL